jgi:membrane-associated phospholipid phosphatase
MESIAKSAELLDPTSKKNIFDYIGFYAPRASIIIVILLLLNQLKFLVAFILFYFINHWVNQFLKESIKQPRPNGSRPIIGEVYDRKSYGMPSYHSQKIWFAVVFVYLVKHNIHLLIIGIFVALITMYQRWKYRAHSIEQLAIGALLGAGIAYIGVEITNMYLRYYYHHPQLLNIIYLDSL